jgi:hypothetical protein
VLRRVLDRDGMDKLSISGRFMLRATCLESVPVYVVQGFCIVNRASPLFSGLAYCLEIGLEQLNLGEA